MKMLYGLLVIAILVLLIRPGIARAVMGMGCKTCKHCKSQTCKNLQSDRYGETVTKRDFCTRYEEG